MNNFNFKVAWAMEGAGNANVNKNDSNYVIWRPVQKTSVNGTSVETELPFHLCN